MTSCIHRTREEGAVATGKFDNLSKLELIELLKMYAGNAVTIDGLWFSIL